MTGDRDDDPAGSRPESLRGWVGSYDYPDEIVHGPRRGRRRAKRRWREQERRDRQAWLTRERDTAGPVRALAGLAAFALCVGVVWGVSQLLWDDKPAPGTAATAAGPSAITTPEQPAVPPATTNAPKPTPSPLPSVDRGSPERVAREWVRAYLARDPVADQTHEAAIDRASDLAIPILSANLAAYPDAAWNELVASGGIAAVTGVEVGPAAGTLPVDTPLRVWRQAVARIAIDHGATGTTIETRTLQVEVVNGPGGWLVSRVLGV